MARGRKPKVVGKHEGSGLDPAPQASAPVEKPTPPYREHMGNWESKAESKAAKAKSPEGSSTEALDYAKHPKFHKFKSKGAK